MRKKKMQKILDKELNRQATLANQIQSMVDKTKREYQRLYGTQDVEVFVQQVILDAPIITYILNIEIGDWFLFKKLYCL